MKIVMLRNLIGVERKSRTLKSKDALVHSVEAGDSVGEIKFIGSEYVGPLRVGMKVYYTDNVIEVKIKGEDIQVMSPENVIAFVEGSNEIAEETKA